MSLFVVSTFECFFISFFFPFFIPSVFQIERDITQNRTVTMESPEGLDPVKAKKATIFFTVLGALQIVLLLWSVYILHDDLSDAVAVLPLLINQVMYRIEGSTFPKGDAHSVHTHMDAFLSPLPRL